MINQPLNNLLPNPGHSGTPAIDYTYDDGAVSGAAKYLRRTSVTYPGPSTRRVVYYNYPSSGDGSVLSRLDNIADSSVGTTKYAQYTYLGTGSVAKVAHPAVTNNLVLNYDPAGDGTFSALDQFGQVIDQKWTVNTAAVDEYQYGYDYNGNRNYRANMQSTAKSEFYTYDSLDRVSDLQRGTLNGGNTAISGTPAREEQFSVDELGNWPEYLTKTSGTTDLDQTRAHNAVNETGTITHVTGSTWVSPTYDAAGNMVSGPQPGSETTNGKCIYDAWNRLVQVTNNSNTIVVTYRFDGQGHRVQKLLGSNPASPTSYYDYYYNEDWQVLEERKGGSTNPYAQYVWDPRYIDAPVVRFHDSNTDGTIDDTLYYCEDANMNVTALVDASGTVQERYAYDAYGQVHVFDGSWTARGSSDYGNEILFGGYRYDPETGLYHVRNRMYHPTLGKWTNRDPTGYLANASLYLYVNCNPIKYVDSSGLKLRCIYRGDSRCPEWKYPDSSKAAAGKTIEEVGLKTWASVNGLDPNKSISEHVTGSSNILKDPISARDDAFVSFSESEAVAQAFGALGGEGAKNCRGCVYEVCKEDTDEFWNRAKTPGDWLKDKTYWNALEKSDGKPGNAAEGFKKGESEVSLLGDLDPKDIKEVHPVRLKDCCDKGLAAKSLTDADIGKKETDYTEEQVKIRGEQKTVYVYNNIWKTK